MSGNTVPSMDEWLREAKQDSSAPECGMYLFHNGVVRKTAKAKVRFGVLGAAPVAGMLFHADLEKAEQARQSALKMDGIQYARIWLNDGELQVGDDIMLVLLGGDTRPHVVDALQSLVGTLKNECVTETEISEDSGFDK